MDSVCVCVRVKPISDRDATATKVGAWQIDQHSISQCNQHGKVIQAASYSFDCIFSHESSNVDVYDKLAKPVISSALNGFNATIFAYGQTSSGKTHTMRGDLKSNPGIIPLALKDIFSHVDDPNGRDYVLRVSYMEIYNEVIRDLLNPEGINLKIHESQERGVFVGDLREVCVQSADEVLSLLNAGEARRHVGATNMNEHSSRSHTVFQVIIESRDRLSIGSDDSDESVRVSVLNLVDLAGSEKASLTGAEGIRLKEGAHINKSLLTLGTVIAKLSEGSTTHIPYRESKLTRILQPSLGGNARTAIVCTVNPSPMFSEETNSTLKFASRAKKIKNKPKMNEIMDEKAQLKRYEKEIKDLKRILEASNSTNASQKAMEQLQEEKEKFEQDRESKKKHLTELEGHVSRLMHMMLATKKPDADKKAVSRVRRETWAAAGPSFEVHDDEDDMQMDSDFKKSFAESFAPKQNRKSLEDIGALPTSKSLVTNTLPTNSSSPDIAASPQVLQSIVVDGILYDHDMIRELLTEQNRLREDFCALEHEKLILLDKIFTLEREVSVMPEYIDENDRLKMELDRIVLDLEREKLEAQQVAISHEEMISEKIELAKALMDEVNDKNQQLALTNNLLELHQTALKEADTQSKDNAELLAMKDAVVDELAMKVASLEDLTRDRELQVTALSEELSAKVLQLTEVQTQLNLLKAEIQLTSEASQQVQSSNAELSELRRTHEETMETIRTLTSEITRKELQIQQMKEEERSTLTSNQALIDELHKSVEAYQRNVEASDEIANSLQQQLNSVMQELQGVRSSFEEKVSELDQEKAAHQATCERIQELSLKITESSNKALEMECVANSKERQMQETQSILAQANQTIATKQQEIDQKSAVVKELEIQIEQLNHRIEGLEFMSREKAEEWERRFTEQKKLVEDTERALQFEKEDSERYQEELNQTRKMLKATNPQQVQKDKENTRKDMEKLQKKIEELEGKAKQLLQEKQAAMTEKNSKELELKNLQKTHKMTEAQLEKLKATDTKTKDNTRKIEMLTKKGDELGQQVEKLKEDLAKKTQAYDVLLQELEALKETKGKADVQIAELQERVAQLTQDLDSAVTLSGQRLSQTVEAQQRISILEGEISSVKELFDKQVAQLQHFEKRCDVLISAECDYKARVAHLEDRLSTVLQDFSISRAQSAEKAVQMEAEIERLQNSLNDAHFQFEEEKAVWSSELQTIQGKLIQLENMLAESQQSREAIEKEYQVLETARQQDQESFRALQQQLKSMKESELGLERKLLEFESALSEKSNTINRLSDEKRQAIEMQREQSDTIIQALRDNVSELLAESESKDKVVQQYQEKIEDAQRKMIQLERKVEAESSLVENFRQQLSMTLEEKTESSSLLEQFTQKIQVMAQEKTHLENLVEKLQSESAHLRVMHSDLQEAFESQKDRMKTVQQQHADAKQQISSLESSKRESSLIIKDLNDKLASDQSRISQLTEELHEALESVRNAQLMSQSKDKHIHDLENMMHESNMELESTKAASKQISEALKSARVNLDSANARLVELEVELDTKIRQICDLEKALASQTQGSEAFVQLLEDKTTAEREWKIKLQSMESHVAELEAKYETKVQDADVLKSQLTSAESGKGALIEKMQELEVKVCELVQDLQAQDEQASEQAQMITTLLEKIQAQDEEIACIRQMESCKPNLVGPNKPEEKVDDGHVHATDYDHGVERVASEGMRAQSTSVIVIKQLEQELLARQDEVERLSKQVEVQSSRIKELNVLIEEKETELQKARKSSTLSIATGHTVDIKKESTPVPFVIFQDPDTKSIETQQGASLSSTELDQLRKRVKETDAENSRLKKWKRECLVAKRDLFALESALQSSKVYLESSLGEKDLEVAVKGKENGDQQRQAAVPLKEIEVSKQPFSTKRAPFRILEDQ
eukprot:TRINITY_DN9055_c0_g1_i4.p1 TRINITY_DN9055_c0_g1~~TRINITY_DN9055_c0_g1_i4.p1  ORF type:complete len:1927 (+),score=590.84 TRINITY_DN9055_c0_g1_i4:53-5833(+)